MQPSNKNFDWYYPHISTIFADNSITEEEFKKALLKPNKTADYDNINVNVTKKTYEELKTPLKCVF